MVLIDCFVCGKKMLDKVKFCLYCDFVYQDVLIEDIECKYSMQCFKKMYSI